MTTKGMDQKELQDEAVVSGFKYFDPYPCEEDSHPFSDLEQQNINKNTSKPTQVLLIMKSLYTLVCHLL